MQVSCQPDSPQAVLLPGAALRGAARLRHQGRRRGRPAPDSRGPGRAGGRRLPRVPVGRPELLAQPRAAQGRRRDQGPRGATVGKQAAARGQEGAAERGGEARRQGRRGAQGSGRREYWLGFHLQGDIICFIYPNVKLIT